MSQGTHDFLMEKRLRSADPQLHQRFSNAVFALQHTLSSYRRLFPEYTDHSELHSMTVIDFCNLLIGENQIDKLNADELYILLMSCYLHDVGMGISEQDYHLFKQDMDADGYFAAHPDAAISDFVRTYHNEFSGKFIEKYGYFLDIPSEEHCFCIIQVSRGHRKTDLMDKTQYPVDFRLPNGNTVCLPYLAALIRLADEIDATAARNSALLNDISLPTTESQLFHNRILAAVRKLDVTQNSFILEVEVEPGDDRLYAAIVETVRKMQDTLDLCRSVVQARSSCRILQEHIRLQRIEKEASYV